ncbi:hypothetical protein PR003_g19833 [Phytophthora rubi]|uniref:Uncharacterized protein n=1 Tax=Phytophthora rubi TaxID=129364 RepID=A0A6A4E1Y6_9STRA|nr:hypothetical protein PR001_g18705 [Phytophthora rubi]KAE9312175.1 hypothetical protein PR003_g19833 [Phytophthora rubi]
MRRSLFSLMTWICMWSPCPEICPAPKYGSHGYPPILLINNNVYGVSVNGRNQKASRSGG